MGDSRVTVDRNRAALSRQQARAVTSLVAQQEKLDQLDKMRAKQERARDRAIAHAASVGINHAEIGRLIGLTKGAVWQKVKSMAGEWQRKTPAEGGDEDA